MTHNPIPENHDDQTFKDLFAQLPKYKCPDHVTDAIANATFKKIKHAPKGTIWTMQPVLRWAAPVIAVCLVLFIFYRIHQPEPNTPKTLDGYTEADLKKLEAQTRYSLAYVGQLMNETKKETVQDVVLKQLPETIRESLNTALPILKGGSK